MMLSALAAIVLVAVTVALHYEVLYALSIWLPRLPVRHRASIVAGVVGALLAHSAEIWIFALAYYWLGRWPSFGALSGDLSDGLLGDCLYFSFASYTTLGFGDVVAVGPMRYLSGMEALTGLVLITWTASFLYLQMESFWEKGEVSDER